MRRIRKAKYTPFEAYSILCHQIENKHTEYFSYFGFPQPRFAIIRGKYFFPTRQENKLSCTYAGWEFNQNTGKYRRVYNPYVRLYFDCYNFSRQYELLKNMTRLISLRESIHKEKRNNPLPEEKEIEEVYDFFMRYINKIDVLEKEKDEIWRKEEQERLSELKRTHAAPSE